MRVGQLDSAEEASNKHYRRVPSASNAVVHLVVQVSVTIPKAAPHKSCKDSFG
jgi:hypothetical protein